MKRLLLLFAAAALFACSPQTVAEEPEIDPSSLKAIRGSIPVTENSCIYEGCPSFTLVLENPNEVDVKADINVRFETDKGKALFTLEAGSVTVPASGIKDVDIAVNDKMEPGFYKASCFVNGRNVKALRFGIDPFDIVSAPDKQADFDQFWEDAINQLKSLEMQPRITQLPKKTGVYLVEINSVPDGLTGEPVTVRGYLAEPSDASADKKYPVLIHFEGYDSQNPTGKLSCPSGATNFIEFYFSTRGQVINNRTAGQRTDGIDQDFVNTYGDWFAFNFGQRDAYYYRGAFMDCVQAVRFVASREGADIGHIFAEGKSQGGAFSYACAALSTDYPLAAIAPGVAFLGDFPDYFEIAGWPASTAKAEAKKVWGDPDKDAAAKESMFAFLSYFDTKNLATRISCPIIANIGLKDETCPPHTNIAPYNNALTPKDQKQMYFYPDMGHDIPSGWDTKIRNFFKTLLK